jgi:hypothetical protein
MIGSSVLRNTPIKAEIRDAALGTVLGQRNRAKKTPPA